METPIGQWGKCVSVTSHQGLIALSKNETSLKATEEALRLVEVPYDLGELEFAKNFVALASSQ